MLRWPPRLVVLVAALVAFGGVMYQAGRGAGASAQLAAVSAMPAQQLPVRPEMVPFPAPGRPDQTQTQGQDCQPLILLYHDGKLYQLMPGPDNQPGGSGSPPEYYPLRPYQGPQIPGLPFGPFPTPAPQGPGFQPLQPRF
jgi:hypothetical protein